MTTIATSKSCVGKSDTPPAPQYARSEQELAEVSNFVARQRQSPPLAPFKSVVVGNTNTLAVNHPDPHLAGVRLAAALATTDATFADGIITQLSQLATGKDHVIEASQLDILFAVVKGIAPQDPLETLLACQMAAIHAATMTFARTLKKAEYAEQQAAAITGLNKLARTFAIQVETLKKYRSSGEQNIRVQHVTVHDGGQAIVAETVTGGGGPTKSGQSIP
jgi:hypothetical protein